MKQHGCLQAVVVAFLLLGSHAAWPWGGEGHSIVGELAQRRLTPLAALMVDTTLGRGYSLGSIASWADDARDVHPETYNWHFVDIPIKDSTYDPATQCAPSPKGDCAIAALERLKKDMRCGATPEIRRDALRYAVHIVGDIHQPLHTVADAIGGNQIQVDVTIMELKCTKNCKPRHITTNLHAFWDETVITSTTWNWGAFVSRLEEGWLQSAAARGADTGTPIDWLLESHKAAQQIWSPAATTKIIDDAYYKTAVSIAEQQLARAGLRLAKILNDAYADQCPSP